MGLSQPKGIWGAEAKRYRVWSETVNQALSDLWNAFRNDIPFDPNFGIVKYWIQNYKELGSPVGPEHPDGKNIYQAFANAIVRWTPGGPEIV